MGGCVSSNVDINDRRPNVFHVWNVDELGNILIPGQIEVTDTELVLYHKGKEPIRWPMRCLRRYGFDAELFSFESGRRCATGTGIYAFKCQRAEALFNLLQEQIQNSGQDGGGQMAMDSSMISSSNQTVGNLINSHSGVCNGVVVATAVAANGSILRSGSLSVSDTSGPGGNYLEPIVRYRARSINNNITNNNNNNNNTITTTSNAVTRDGFSRLTTQSLPSNLALTENGTSLVTVTSTMSPHYVNDDVTSNCCSTETGVNLRSPLTPPAVLPALHEYANTTLLGSDSESSVALASSASRPKSLQECHQLSITSIGKTTTTILSDDLTGVCDSVGVCSTTSPTLTTTNTTISNSVHPKKALYPIHDLPNNALVGAGGPGNGVSVVPIANVALTKASSKTGCRQVVLRGHSLDETTNYARLDELLKQEHTSAAAAQQRHLYMNVVPDNVQKTSKEGTGSHHPNHHHHHHHHHATGKFCVRQKSVESPSTSSISSSSGIPTASSVGTATNSSSTKDSTNHHHHHHSNSISYHPISSGTSSSSVVTRQVNYVVLDLNHRGSNSSGGSVSTCTGGDVNSNVATSSSSKSDTTTAPTSPVSLQATPPPDSNLNLLLNPTSCRTSPLEGYATIDFDRTVALSNVSTHPCLDDDESVRKTRHNCTINDLLLSKHGSIVSE